MVDVRAELGFCRALTEERVIDALAKCLTHPENRVAVVTVLRTLHESEPEVLSIILVKLGALSDYWYATILSEIVKYHEDAAFRQSLCALRAANATYGEVLLGQLMQYFDSDWIVGLA